MGELSYLTGQDNGVYFLGPETTQRFEGIPAIHAPATYDCAATFSHWAAGMPGVMGPDQTEFVMRRSFADFEIGMLMDLGYVNAAARGVVLAEARYVSGSFDEVEVGTVAEVVWTGGCLDRL
jgi:hypothetical protein